MLRHEFVDVVVVAVLDAGVDPPRPHGPETVAHSSLGEARHLEAIGERTLAEASNPPCWCDVSFRFPDRITDCIRRAPESCPRLTTCDLWARLRRACL